jgi:putative FmdB family regulatory protein
MPIYEYRCSSCGFEKEVLQKMSEPILSQCPSCGRSSFKKLVSAAGFQLKGSGWYATDFKGGSKGGKDAEGDKKGDAKSTDAKPADGKAADGAKSGDDSKPKEKPEPATGAGASPTSQ